MEPRFAVSARYLNLACVLLLALVAAYYDYSEIAFKRPQSIHKWRQTDCASLALNYYRHGMNLFEPRTHNLTSDGGTTAYACPSEVPVLYYAVAFLYKICGPHDSVYRIFNTLLFLLGLFYLFRLANLILEDFVWSASICLIVFSSPVLAYYGNNFLTNSNALAFSFMGWYYFFKHERYGGSTNFMYAFLAFLFASAFKLTGLISVFAILYYALFYGNNHVFEKKKRKHPLCNRIQYASIFSIPILIGLWTLYANMYNDLHDCSYFSTTVFPIWNLNKNELDSVIENVRNVWFYQYFHPSVLAVLLSALVYIIIRYRKLPGSFFWLLFVMFFQCLFFILLQFWNFADHDYYVVELYIFPALILVFAAYVLKHHLNSLFEHPVTKILMGCLVLLNVMYAKSKLQERYHSWMNDYDQYKDLYDITPKLRQLGIHEADKVIFISDPSHAALYLMDQPGWTTYTDAQFNRGQKRPYNQDSIGIAKSMELGARYMMVNGVGEFQSRPYLQPFCKNLLARIGNVFIFDLVHKNINFEWRPDKIKRQYHCDAETRTMDGLFFTDTSSNIQFEFGMLQSSEETHTGRYAIKLSKEQPYGLTFKMNELEEGDRIRIRIWRSPGAPQSVVWISSIDEIHYYNNKVRIYQTDEKGWQQIVQDFTIDSAMAGKELKMYAFNPSDAEVFFDDLEVHHYYNPLVQR